MDLLEPIFDCNDVGVLTREESYRGYTAMETLTLHHAQFQGGRTQVLSRECQNKPPVVAVLPYDPELDQVVLIEQFRVGALEDSVSPWLIEVVAGVSDKTGESLEDLAKREVLEETGLAVHDLALMHTYWVSPGGSNEHVTLFCGKVSAPASGGFYGLSHEGEDIRSMVMSVDQALQILAEGRISSSLTLIALQWLALHKDALSNKW